MIEPTALGGERAIDALRDVPADDGSGERLAGLARLAARALGVPVGRVVLAGDAGPAPSVLERIGLRAAAAGETWAVADLRQSTEGGDAAEPEVVAVACTPLDAGGRVLGALCVAAPQARAWTADEVATLEEFAAAAAEVAEALLSARARTRAAEGRAQEAEFALDGLGDGVLALDREGRVRRASRRAAALLQRSAEDLLGASIWDVLPEPVAHALRPEAERALAEGVPCALVLRWPSPARWLEARVLPAAAGLVVCLRDVTTHQETARRLVESEQYYKSLFEHNPAAIFSVDLQGRLLSANPAGSQLSGYRPGSLIGQSILPLLAPEDRERAQAHLERALRGKPQTEDFTILNPEGARIEVRVTSVPIVIDGEIVGIFGVAEDLGERRRAEEARARLAAIVESSDDAILGVDLAGAIMSWNRAAERLYGYAAEEAIGQPIDRIVPPERQGELVDLLGRLGRGERVEQYETVRVRKDGRRIDVALTLSPIRDANGAMVGAAEVARDITERKRAEARQRLLAEASALLSTSLDFQATLSSVARLAVPTLADCCSVSIIEPDGTARRLAIVAANPAIEQAARRLQERYARFPGWLLGVPEVLRSRRSAFFPDVSDALLQGMARDEGHLATLRALGLRSLMIVPLIARGRTLGAIAFASTQPDRRYSLADLALAEELASQAAFAVDNARLYREAQQAEERARRQAARLNALAEASRAFSEASLDYRQVLDTVARHIAEQMSALCIIRLLSDDREWLVPAALYHPLPAAHELIAALASEVPVRADQGVLREVIATGRLVHIAEVTPEQLREMITPAYWPYVERFPITSVVVAPLRAQGQVIGALGLWRSTPNPPLTRDDARFVQDLADRAAQSIENARLYQAAQEAIGLRDEFLSVAAHELKTPVTSLRGFAQLLLRQIEKTGSIDVDRVRRGVQQIEQQSTRLGRLIAQLLDVSRLEGGHLTLERSMTDVVWLVQEAVAVARASGTRHAIVVRAPDALPALVDPIRLEQVLANLLDNAIKYSPGGGTIEVEVATPDRDTVELSVRDHGVGIPPERRERIFNRFYQAHAHQHYGGMGLGLYISRQIVTLHGGDLTVEFPEDGGTRFVVTLPLPVEAGQEGEGRVP